MTPVPSPARPHLPSASGTLSLRSYAYLQQYIRTESGIVVEDDKQYLLETRLTPVLKEHNLKDLDALVASLSSRSGSSLGRRVIDAMTTNETLFFRDSSLFEALRTQVLPQMLERTRGRRPARIWSAAASSGQEAYSISMLLLEAGAGRGDVEVIGTDLSSQVLERARQGSYGQFEVSRGLPANYLLKYFDRSGLHWKVKDGVKKLVRFDQLDLRKDVRFLGDFDLILCRNVLIYFDAATKEKILESMRLRLSSGGLLTLGCAETIINIHSGFRRKSIAQANFYCRSEEL